MRLIGLLGVTVTLGLVACPSAARAYEDGISSTRCADCHSGGSGTTSAVVSFGSTPIVGEPVTITVTVENDAPGDYAAAGFNLRMSSGTFSSPPGVGAERAFGDPLEATHSEPRPSRSWSLTWTPTASGAVGWEIWANSVNDNGLNTGDAPMTDSQEGTVTVRRPRGASCSMSTQCGTGHCVDGVCCESACSADCRACAPAAGGSSPAGTCSVLVADSPGCCDAGYRWTGSTCEEIDECGGANDCCVAGTPGCDASAVCGNTDGGYECDCAPGFSGDGLASGTGCVTCPPGTTTVGDDQHCSDIDECATASCGPGACVQIPLASWVAPGFTCNCDPGYEQTDSPTRSCRDIDECARGTDDCSPEPAGICANTIGGFECACNAPAFVGATGRDCVDFDECTDDMYSARCSSVARCENGYGTWDCVCTEGFEGDGFTCTDIPECDRDLDDCHVNATCMNTLGAYTCTCNEGYEGTGVFCRDENECADGTHGCTTGEVCVNVLGAPNECVCEPGYTRASADAPCEVRCGDGARGRGEACDDGNTADGDGCSAACAIEPGWACREPTTTGQSTCSETCGDALVDELEECDDGAANSDTDPDACRTTCRRAHCGDAVLDTGEACDDGAGNDDTAPDGCRSTCEAAFCGDGIVDTGELCDPGGGVPGASIEGACTTRCAPDAGIDPAQPPELTGGACACRAGAPASAPPAWWLLAVAALGLVRRRRSRVLRAPFGVLLPCARRARRRRRRHR